MRQIKITKGLLIVLILSLFPLLNLFHSGLPITHDGLDHAIRIASFYKSLTEGNLIPRWAGELNWGYGHPVLMFLYPLPSYLASFFHFVGFSFVDSLKILFGSAFILSGIFMYLWLRKFLNDKAAIIGAVLYLFAPYRFIDLYVRGAIGEHVAFLFLPLVLYAILKLNKLPNIRSLRSYYVHFIFIAFSFAGLILSHNAISLLFIPFVVFYIFYLYYENKSKIKLIFNFMSLLFGFFLSFFFWFPAFMEGKYTLRDIVTEGAYLTRFVDVKGLIYSSWNFGGTGQLSVQLGIAGIILSLVSIIFLNKIFKKNDKQKYLFLGSVLFLLASIILMLPQSNIIWHYVTTLQKLQFPWRFLSIALFCMSLIGALTIYKLKPNNYLVLAIIFLAIIPTISYWHPKEYKNIPDSFFENIYRGTTDTGESSPIWSIRFMEDKPKDVIEVIEGNSKIVKLERKTTYHEYVIKSSGKTRIRENTLYFPGWKVYDNYKLINFEFQDPKNRGLITFYIDEGLHDIIVKFEDTKLRRLANWVSLFSVIALILIPLIFLTFPKLKIGKYQW